MNNILKFKQCLDTDKKNRELYNKMDIIQRGFNDLSFFSFHLAVKEHCGLLCGTPEYLIIKLDEEDIKYLSDKYLPKLQDEMNAEIDKIKKEYETR